MANLAWAECRKYLAAYSGGSTHGQRARHKAALTEILEWFTAKQNGNPAECLSALHAKAQTLQNAPTWG
jgi:hypothetical protein